MTPTNDVRREWRERIDARWRELPAALRTEQQVAGRGGVACGATWGVMEKCNFACTSCYLTELGNHVEPLPFAEVAAQLETLRAGLGPGARVQITSGEVTLLAVEELGRIVAHARSLGLDPMVMTNGERFRRDPRYLVRLVRDFGLRKLSLHVDTTQVGRRWSPDDPRAPMPLGLRERDLHALRDEFVERLDDVRAVTGVDDLHVAHTVTVTPRTLDDVADVTRWFLGQSSIRLLSFLPVAAVGRTEDDASPELTMDAVWERVERGAGRALNRDAMHFGHRECNITVPVLSVRAGTRPPELVEVVRASSRWDRRVFGRILDQLVPALDVDRGLVHNALRALGVAARSPRFGAELLGWLGARAFGLTATMLRVSRLMRVPRLQPRLLVVHKFMAADELETPLGRERLDGCVFKLPLADGRLVSMCEMNATDLRRGLNERHVARPTTAAPTRAPG